MRRLHQGRTGTGLLFAVAALLAGCSDEGIVSPGVMQGDEPLAAMQSAARTEHGQWTAFEVLQTTHGPPPPWEIRFVGNTRHDLGVQVKGVLDGDIVATFTATIHAHLHRLRSNPAVHAGPARLVGTWVVTELFGEPVSGTFEASGHGYRELPGPFTGHLRAKGTGELDGMKLKATFENGAARGTFVIKGLILDP